MFETWIKYDNRRGRQQRLVAFHPFAVKEEKGSPSKLPTAESLTCLKSETETERGGGREREALRPSALVG